MKRRAFIAAMGYVAVAAFFLAGAFTSVPSTSDRIAKAEEVAQAELSREVAAMRLARTIKRSSPVFTATAKDSAS